MEKIEEAFNMTIKAGTQYGRFDFKPQAGLVIATAIFPHGGDNPGFVSAKISGDDGREISPATDIRNYRDREAGYREGKKPMNLDTQGKSFVFEIFASEPFATDLKVNWVLVYEPNYTKKDC